jgi:hypothetical protein
MSHRLQVLIPESLAARLRQVAERNRISQGEWVRRKIERALDEERVSSDPLATLASLEAPTADLEQMLAEIESGRAGT